MFIAGASLGWLVGLSASPVIQGIITALTGIIVALGGLYSGSTTPPAGIQLSPSFLAMLLVGVALGTSSGLYCRTHNTLGADAKSVMLQMQELGIPQDEIRAHVARRLLGTVNESTAQDIARQQIGQLYEGIATDDVAVLRGKKGQELVSLMKSSPSIPISRFAARCEKHPECLKAFVEEILCKK
jgi:hypothetical protein